jgi:hypothetical protein
MNIYLGNLKTLKIIICMMLARELDHTRKALSLQQSCAQKCRATLLRTVQKQDKDGGIF